MIKTLEKKKKKGKKGRELAYIKSPKDLRSHLKQTKKKARLEEG